ncbi:MAG: amylo-alpha-1,6-glucosidase [bacterium]|nr:amylo-alpha-1,6-glucosidase [bacterium]
MPTPERIRIGTDYYLLASALAARRPRLVLSHRDSFAIFDDAGDVPPAGVEPYGLFHRGTRFLSRFELRLNDGLPVLLSSAPGARGSTLVSHLANGDERRDGEVVLERDVVALERTKVLCDAVLHERVHVRSYAAEPLRVRLSLLVAADFADEFEVRGVERARHGTLAEPEVRRDGIRVRYLGLDGVTREMRLACEPPPADVRPGGVHFLLDLPPRGETVLVVSIGCVTGGEAAEPCGPDAAIARLRAERRHRVGELARIRSSNEAFDAWMRRSLDDLAMLRTDTPAAGYVQAGIPWFATVFGRDGLVTAFETLAFGPDLAAAVLRTLAALQGRHEDARRDEEPGKILHELRCGEMAATGEVPFGRYYGTVDATPLFLCLLAAYARRTADLALVEALWPAAEAAFGWIEAYGDRDGDGFVEYARRAGSGLVHQGWKDSHDAISHADGGLAEPPIALVEVQAYVFAALRDMAELALRTGRVAAADAWRARAEALRARFETAFWLDDEGTYALALDRDKRPCRVVASNAGHALWAGIAAPERAERVMARLLREDSFCGWGVRTLGAGTPRFNPMSYHNGSVWPHDNALVAAGCARYGATERAAVLLDALFHAGLALDGPRLPELFCGFARGERSGPVPYPVACKPQAWAAASVLLLLQAALGLEVDAWQRRVTLTHATLPPWLDRVDVVGLRVCDARVDLSVHRRRFGAAVEVTGREGDLEVVVRR